MSSSSTSSVSSSSSYDYTDVHHKTIFAQVSDGWQTDQAGATTIPTDLYLSDNLLIDVVCRDAAGAPVDVSGFATYLLGVDDTYVHSGSDLIACTDCDTRNAATGGLTFAVAMSDYAAALQTFLGASAYKPAYMCIWATNGGDDNHLLCSSTINIKNIVGQIEVVVWSSSSSSVSSESHSSLSSVSSVSSDTSSADTSSLTV